MALLRQKPFLMAAGHVAKPKPCVPALGGSAGVWLGVEQHRRGSAEQPRDARSASANLLITHFRTYLFKRPFCWLF